MFRGNLVFNQPLSFDTAEVTDVRVYLFGIQPPMRDQNLIFFFPTRPN